tara:strand:- start:208 stop:786 length:579 start_codon:yes stop_codon:yes gene_type:complete
MIPLAFEFTLAESINKNSESRDEVADWLIRWLQMKMITVKNPAIVFDVDSTLIERKDHKIIRIDPIFRVFQFCRKHNIQCHIVTARPDFKEGRSELNRVMKDMNMSTSKFHSTHMRPPHLPIRSKNLEEFKSNCRDKICKESNATIIANIGDNWHDLGFLSRSLKHLHDDKSYIAFFPGKCEASIKLPVESR